MFTGIVEEVGQVVSAQPRGLVVTGRLTLQGMELGASIAVNGVCLTITRLTSESFSVDVMPETLRRTNLGQLTAGSPVNLERPLSLNSRLGGHLVQGHVDGTGQIIAMNREAEAVVTWFSAPPEVMRYVVEKGFIAVDGVSLTVVARREDSFSVSLVNYTRGHTNLGTRQLGDRVNLEVDIIAKYVERLNQARQGEITPEFLAEHGFLTS